MTCLYDRDEQCFCDCEDCCMAVDEQENEDYLCELADLQGDEMRDNYEY